MKLTSAMIVPEGTREDDAIVRTCGKEGIKTFHVPQKVMVLSAGGARSMRLWTCENHPLPAMVTDDPEKDETA